ncbi:phage gp6-like head-tail connector protein [Listeria sp. FSL L7-1582]|uniref:head-tail connector protein n=1 Tax=Listeria portnoyi TaxID=2713504 RepID=UPI00164CFBC6|nr:head-tail connector protein [Listeria portnoyi]MBC6310146.1 phage gp6-like head-tail connector protein [Listeria portnoyi]
MAEAEYAAFSMENLRNTIKVDHNFDDDLILNVYLEASKTEIRRAITSSDTVENAVFFQNNRLYELAVLLLVKYYYDNRVAATATSQIEIPFGVNSLIQTLRGDYLLWS